MHSIAHRCIMEGNTGEQLSAYASGAVPGSAASSILFGDEVALYLLARGRLVNRQFAGLLHETGK